MLVSMLDKELKRLSVLQEICDQRLSGWNYGPHV